MINIKINELIRPYKDAKTEYQRTYKDFLFEKENMYNISGIDYSKSSVIKVKNNNTGLESLIENIQRLEKEVNRAYNDMLKEKNKIINTFKKVNNSNYEFILEYYLLDNLSDKDICASLKKFNNIEYSEASIARIKKAALNELKKIIK